METDWETLLGFFEELVGRNIVPSFDETIRTKMPEPDERRCGK